MSHDPRRLLKQHGLQPKKSWGQNFLVDPNTVARIVSSLEAPPAGRVVEFGPGTGVLTQHLRQQNAEVYAIERDRDMVMVLQEEFADAPHVRIIAGDAVAFQLSDLPEGDRFYVIGNLPYQLSSPILFSVMEQRSQLHRAVFMLQKEVVDRLCAQPGDGKNYSVLSIRFGAFFRIRRLFNVSKNCFHPKPKVDSAVFRLDPLESPLVSEELETLFAKVVAAAFHQRRKTLVNNLTKGNLGLTKEEATSLLKSVDISPGVRGETLRIEQFAALTEALHKHRESANS